MFGENNEKGILCPFCKKPLSRSFGKRNQGKIASRVVSLINKKKGSALTTADYRFCRKCDKTFIVSIEESKVLVSQMIIKGGKILVKEMNPYYLRVERENIIVPLIRFFKRITR